MARAGTNRVWAPARRELRRMNPEMKIDADEVEEIIRAEVLKRDLVEGERVRKAAARVKKASDRVLRKRSSPKDPTVEEPTTELVL